MEFLIQLHKRKGYAEHQAKSQCVIDAIDAVLLHLQEEAGRHLRVRRARIEEGGAGMREVPIVSIVPFWGHLMKIQEIELVKPKKGTTMQTIGTSWT